MPLSFSGGGYQFGDGNLNEVELRVGAVPVASTSAVNLAPNDLSSDIFVTNGTATITLPTAAQFDAAWINARVGHFVEFSVINISASQLVTMTGNTGVTIVGVAVVPTTTGAAAGTVSSAWFRLMKTAVSNNAGAYTLYRCA